MNPVIKHYELQFECMFHRSKANEFQTLFSTLMNYAYKGDFLPCRPWGNVGDRKNDGFLRSEKRLFQVYAPNEMTAKEAISKINEDFEGGKVHWGEYFEKWSFVHNTLALPPHVHECILDFEKKNPSIKLDTWGLPELNDRLRLLCEDDLVTWLGPPITPAIKVGYKDIGQVLEHISTCHSIDANYPIKDVPMGKIEANMLSKTIETNLRFGLSKTYMVSEFFSKWHDITYGERLATAFRTEYQRLKSSSLHPINIFFELQKWVGGEIRGKPEHELAVLTVLAYFFSTCDIFEAPRQSVT